MKKLLVLFALAAMVLGAAGLANALDVKARGEFRANWNYWSNTDFLSNKGARDQTKHNELVQRARIYMDFRANENVNFQLGLEIGDTFWGDQASGGDISADQKVIEVKRAFMEFKWPTYKSLVSTVGIQGAVFPNSGYFGSAIMDDDIAGITVANKWNDMASTVVGFYRAFENRGSGLGSHNNRVEEDQSQLDVTLLALPLTFDGFKTTPFFSMAFLGKNINETGTTGSTGLTAQDGTASAMEGQATPWWAGAGFEVTALDPFAIYADFNYGAVDQKEQKGDRKGWLADLGIDYKGLSWFTPGVYGWYSTGMDDDINNGDERMPIISDGWTAGTTIFGGARMLNNDLGNVGARQVTGTWGVGMKLAKISFVQDLTHDLYFYYTAGTNDADAVKKGSSLPWGSLTDKDHIVGLDFNNTYKIMEELSFMVDLGIGWADFDKDTWRASTTTTPAGRNVDEQATLYRTSVGLLYRF